VRIEGEMNWLTIEGGGEERRMEEGGRTKSSSLKSRKQTMEGLHHASPASRDSLSANSGFPLGQL
jgi:hypothetical protein